MEIRHGSSEFLPLAAQSVAVTARGTPAGGAKPPKQMEQISVIVGAATHLANALSELVNSNR